MKPSRKGQTFSEPPTLQPRPRPQTKATRAPSSDVFYGALRVAFFWVLFRGSTQHPYRVQGFGGSGVWGFGVQGFRGLGFRV